MRNENNNGVIDFDESSFLSSSPVPESSGKILRPGTVSD